jgi:replicative DNA helicase
MTIDMRSIAQGWADLETSATPTPTREWRHYRPLVEAAHSFEREAKSTKRVYTGIHPIDLEMRGISPGHLAMIVGYSHSGKTLVLLHMLRHNRDKRICLYIPDEPATLVLTKLACLSSGIPARQLEAMVADDDRDAINLLRQVATEEFPNLAVFDKPLAPGDMERAYEEVCDVWGERADLVVVDYLELLAAGETVQQKADWIKAFGSRHEVPLVVLHQTSRSAGAEGRKMTISSGSYGGEQHATFMLGVRRKKSALQAELNEMRERFERRAEERVAERISALEYDLRIAEYTLTVNLVKNKRPGGSLVDDVDFELEQDTGRIWQLQPQELPSQYLASIPNGGHRATTPTRYETTWEEEQLW